MVFSRLFEPIALGPITLKNRLIAPPHAALLGNLLGPAEEAERYISYWRALAEGGTGYLVALNGFLENILPPGFDPAGVGSRKGGVFRNPLFAERMGRIAEGAHGHGAFVATQIIMQGGMPHAPSQTLSGPVVNLVPHALTRAEIAWFIAEYRHSAELALAAGLDGVELHANHDDLIEWFLSPLTNRRNDGYGGSFERRLTFLGQILEAIREGVGNRLVVGVRLNMLEAEPGGYDQAGGLAIAGWLEQTGLVDYVHLVMGTGWGFPSYIQTAHFKGGEWAEMAGQFKRQLSLPVIYGGRVNRPEVAEQIIAQGHADLVSIGRAHLADPAFAAKAAGEQRQALRPCIGTNDCINRTVGEGLPFACTVNPGLAAAEHKPLTRAARPRRLLIIGGGPAGMQLAVTARERGHDVTLWERSPALGGQVRLAAKLPGNGEFLEFIQFLEGRIAKLGVALELERTATAEDVACDSYDVVALATGASPRHPEIAGIASPAVCDMSQVLSGETKLGRRVAIVVQEDHAAPLALGDLLGRHGHDVTLFIQTDRPAPQLSRYSLGTLLGRLSEVGARLVLNEAITAIELPGLRTRHVYSGREGHHGQFDSLVLACGAVSEDRLLEPLKAKSIETCILGDAYAPRRLVFATQQGYELGKTL
jgi:2,4-dienoyl-CoA reductase-like NADH-dependent reductase (Old Yellow Enzyme family)/thioredoxin reductase